MNLARTLLVVGLLATPAIALGSVDLQDGELGSACSAQVACAHGLDCIVLVGDELEIANGVCSHHCDGNLDCVGLWLNHSDVIPYCAPVGDESLCLEPCVVGSDTLAVDKCHRRPDQACALFEVAADGTRLGGCIAQCTLDSQCGERRCDTTSGLCRGQRVVGDPVGANCDPSAVSTTCAGWCNPLSDAEPDSAGTCTESCVVGGPVACGWSGEGIPDALCDDEALSLAPGDLGHCVQLCDCDADCTTSGSICWPLFSAYGHAGRCAPAGNVTEHIAECEPPAAPGQCLDGDVRTCKGEHGCFGTSACLDDQSGYGDCVCVDEPQGGQGGQATGGSAAVGGESQVGGVDGGGAASAIVAGEPAVPNRYGKTPQPGCDCSVPARRSGFGAAGLLAVLGLAALTRRSRRPPRGST